MDKWNNWYRSLNGKQPNSFCYGNTVTYKLGGEWLKDCNIVEDWGCGAGGFIQHCRKKYIGVDGSNTPFAHKKVDLVNYTSSADGIFMRHVLEHNYEWEQLLQNAISSFTKRMCLILFTPFAENDTLEIAHNLKHGVDVPDLSLSKKRLEDIFISNNIKFSLQTMSTDTGYKIEHVYFLEK